VTVTVKRPSPPRSVLTTTGGRGEQIVIRRDTTTGQFIPGEYRFWVNNFSQSPDFDVSQARAVIAQGGQQIGVFPAAAATGDPRLDIWYVVNLTIDAAGNIAQAPVQRFMSGSEVTVLGLPPSDSRK
jgi:hypothetical protein